MWPFTKHRATSGGAPSGGLRCSFCKKHQNEVQKLVAGPGVYICDKCIKLCNDVIADESAEREETQRKEEAGWGASLPRSPSRAKRGVGPPAVCRLCGLPTPIQDVIAVPDRGFLCLVCVDIIRASSEQDSKN